MIDFSRASNTPSAAFSPLSIAAFNDPFNKTSPAKKMRSVNLVSEGVKSYCKLLSSGKAFGILYVFKNLTLKKSLIYQRL